ncbi:MAG TPA: pilus assembly protein TadG-related protein [Terriglobales bacterium]|nr:pilus assembly protein TadG-related protein [Terriglobales bacterium]
MVKRSLRALLDNRKGSVAVYTALTMFVVLAATGLAVDTGRAFLIKSKLSQALDAAALAGGKSYVVEDSDADIKMFFSANYPTNYLGSTLVANKDTGSPLTITQGGKTINVSATATLNTYFGDFIGHKVINISATSQVTRNMTALDVVLAIDMSQSMNCSISQGTSANCSTEVSGSKLSAVRTDATDLVDTLFDNQGDSSTVTTSEGTFNLLQVGVVPYAGKVNVISNDDGTMTTLPTSIGGKAQAVTAFTNPVTGTANQSNVYYATKSDGTNMSDVPMLKDPSGTYTMTGSINYTTSKGTSGGAYTSQETCTYSGSTTGSGTSLRYNLNNCTVAITLQTTTSGSSGASYNDGDNNTTCAYTGVTSGSGSSKKYNVNCTSTATDTTPFQGKSGNSYVNNSTGCSYSGTNNLTGCTTTTTVPFAWQGCVYARYLDDYSGSGNSNDADLTLDQVTVGGKSWPAWEPVPSPEGEPQAASGSGASCTASGWNNGSSYTVTKGSVTTTYTKPSYWITANATHSDNCPPCPVQGITKISPHSSPAKTAISHLASNGGSTNITQGLFWAYELVMHGTIFTQSVDNPPFPRDRAVVILTDGYNTGFNGDGYKGSYGMFDVAGTTTAHGTFNSVDGAQYDYPTPNTANKNNMNGRLLQLAGDMKRKGVRIYVIQYAQISSTADKTTQTLLQQVASGTDEPYYFNAASDDDLQAAFSKITADLSKLRVSE